MENYEKKYKEALERANQAIKECGANQGRIKMIESIFPELKESEDERIRKVQLDYWRSVGGKEWYGVPVQETIAWLEKQGEQKPKFRVGDTIKCKYDDRQFTIKSVNLDEGTYTYTQEGCGNDIDYADEEFELVEQKPTDKVEPKFKVGSQEYPLTPSECFKPAWSEEDEKIYQSIIDDTVQENQLDDKQINWLKSIKDRIQPQPKQEWNVQDEAFLGDAIYAAKNTYSENCGQKELIDWLKSFKPNHWKPSEQNIKDLEWCSDLVKDKMGVGFHRLQVFIDELKSL